MKIGFVGLGKLGLPCALAVEAYGKHEVFGYEIDPGICVNILRRQIPYREAGAQELLDLTHLTLCNLDQLVSECEIVFVAVQTPHDPRFEGITPLPDERADFNYDYLREAVRATAESAERQGKEIVLVVISTVLPGTVARELKPFLNRWTKLCYNPFFIAMGTTIHDFMHPEFVLVGSQHPEAIQQLTEFYETLHGAKVVSMSIESAELTKVAYNTFIGMKIVFANTLMEICEGTGANVDDVTGALGQATTRLISSKYLQAGMGDGGGCHPRDNIAMSYLARDLDLSYDFFESLMLARERQTAWLADYAVKVAAAKDLPVVILGKAFKPETNLVVGSPALLLRTLLENRGIEAQVHDPLIDTETKRPTQPAVYVVATKHAVFADWRFPTGSVVLDPWGYMPDQNGVLVRRIGRGPVQAIVELEQHSKAQA